MENKSREIGFDKESSRKKKICFLILIFVLFIILIGCSKNDKEKGRKEKENLETMNEIEQKIQTENGTNIILYGLDGEELEGEEKKPEPTSEQKDSQEKKEYIKWVDFGITYEALDEAYKYDVNSYGESIHLNWIELLAYLGAKYGGDFKRYKSTDMKDIVTKLTEGKTIQQITENMKYYSYYYEVYQAVLGGMVGEYEIETQAEIKKQADEQTQLEITKTEEEKTETEEKKTETTVAYEKKYGLKAYSPIAKNFPYSDYDDFGASRSYGYKRVHLGHDMMGATGTPIIAVESGYVEALGWNQYGGWRIGIRSFDKKRYYYYAHLRKDFPYNKSLEVGSIVQAGDVIGYLGHTGYSAKENVNNIETPHLHFGIQLIFDESQKEGNNEIWIDCYAVIRFLYRNRSETVKIPETKEWVRTRKFIDPSAIEYKKSMDKKK